MSHLTSSDSRENSFRGSEVPKGTYVRVLEGFFAGLDFPVERDWLVIGRGRGADFVINERTISRAHAAVGFEKMRFFLQDLGSTNGTMLNGEPVSKIELKSGDEIQMGKLRLGFHSPQQGTEE